MDVSESPTGSEPRESGAAPPECANDDFQSDLGWGIGAVSTMFRKWATDAVRDVPGGLRGFIILAAIAQDRPASQLALAQRLGFDKSAMTALVDGLENDDLLHRQADPDDRRARHLVITPHGAARVAQARARLALAEERLLTPLDSSDAALFRRLIATIALFALGGNEGYMGDGSVDDEDCR